MSYAKLGMAALGAAAAYGLTGGRGRRSGQSWRDHYSFPARSGRPGDEVRFGPEDSGKTFYYQRTGVDGYSFAEDKRGLDLGGLRREAIYDVALRYQDDVEKALDALEKRGRSGSSARGRRAVGVTFKTLSNGNVRVRWDGLRRNMFVDVDPDPYRGLTAMESAQAWATDVLGWERGHGARGRRAATRRRTYKTLTGLKRAMGDRGQLSLETIFSERANIKGVGWTPIRYTLTDEDISEIATMLGGRERTQDAVANGLRDGRLWRLPYSTRQRITWDKHGWGYIAGQDYPAETARIRNILKK